MQMDFNLPKFFLPNFLQSLFAKLITAKVFTQCTVHNQHIEDQYHDYPTPTVPHSEFDCNYETIMINQLAIIFL